MNIIIRADSSNTIGSGHVMRCLTLADELKEYGEKIIFLCQSLLGNMNAYIQEKGYQVLICDNDDDTISCMKKIQQPIDWLIIDHYAIDIQWEFLMRPYVKKIMVIDDIADRAHDCDLLLDQNFYLNMEQRYQSLFPSNCQTLFGPQYSLLRKQFYTVRQSLRNRDGVVRRILVFFGGSDPTNETAKTLQAIERVKIQNIAVDVVVGRSNFYAKDIEMLCNNLPNTTFYCQVENMAELMAKADIAIGAGGTATWERCYLGLPSIVIVVADNQVEVTEAVASVGALMNLGDNADVNSARLSEAIEQIIAQPALLKQLSKNAFSLMGAYQISGAKLVIQKMREVYAGT